MRYVESTYTMELTRDELKTLCDALRTSIEALTPEDFVGSDPSYDYKRLKSFIGAVLGGGVPDGDLLEGGDPTPF